MLNSKDSKRFISLWTRFVVLADALQIKYMITYFYRTAEEQKALFDEGKSKCDGYIKISPHQECRAIDIAFLRNGIPEWKDNLEYHQLGEAWERIGGTWGGRFESLNDIYHFEISKG